MSADRRELRRQLLDRVVETLIVVHCGGPSDHEQLERARAEPQAFDRNRRRSSARGSVLHESTHRHRSSAARQEFARGRAWRHCIVVPVVGSIARRVRAEDVG